MTLPPIPVQQRIRFALVGCGRVASRHVAAIRQHPEHAELVGVCDVDATALKRVREQTGAAGYESLSALLSQTSADVVVLATPSGLHAEQTIEIATSGRHVITEKPMATRWQDAQRMVAACDAAGVRLFVVKQIRFSPILRLLKRAIAQGRFGKIYLVTINVFWSRPQEYYDSAAWRGTLELDGGALMNQASHYADLIEWLIGPLESVQAYAATLGRRIEVEDSAVLSLRWRSGALGSMNVTMLAHQENFEASITIVGEHGNVRIGGAALGEVQHWQFAQPHPDDAEVHQESKFMPGLGHALYYGNAIDVLRGQGEPATDGREGLKSLEVLMAAYRSACEGRRISLPLDGQSTGT